MLAKKSKVLDGKIYLTNDEAMALSVIAKAIQGDTRAFEVVRDTIGQMPVKPLEFIDTQAEASAAAKREIEDLKNQLKNPAKPRIMADLLKEGDNAK